MAGTALFELNDPIFAALGELHLTMNKIDLINAPPLPLALLHNLWPLVSRCVLDAFLVNQFHTKGPRAC